MADDEAESEPASKDQVTSPLTRPQARPSLSLHHQTDSTDATSTQSQSQSQSQSPSSSSAFSSKLGSSSTTNCEESASGIRWIVIERSEYGFGFTLRHFIVYPPESSAILARERHLGFRRPTSPNEPIDTIFVKNVRENGPAHVAGLATGDRIISVNGQNIAGLSYLRVVNLIFKTKGCLRLAVVPQQNDALQLYFGEAAHHPESNRKPRLCLADATSLDSASSVDAAAASTMSSSNTRRYSHSQSRTDRSPLYASFANATSPPTTQQSKTRMTTTPTTPTTTTDALWSTLAPPSPSLASQTASDASSCCSNESAGTATAPNLNCAYSLDVEFDRNNCDSLSDSSLKDYHACDDSVVMNRLRKSMEQKQEFLNRLPRSPPPLPVASPPSSPPDADADADVDADSTTFQQMVSVRAKQFENGPSNDKTELFRSELARLSVKRNAANVATRRRDFENRAFAQHAQLDKRNVSTAPKAVASVRLVNDRANDHRVAASASALASTQSCSGAGGGGSSGNQTIPVGSNKLHCEPPSEFNSYLSTKFQDDNNKKRTIGELSPTPSPSSSSLLCESTTNNSEPRGRGIGANGQRATRSSKTASPPSTSHSLVPIIRLNGDGNDDVGNETRFRALAPINRLSLPNYNTRTLDLEALERAGAGAARASTCQMMIGGGDDDDDDKTTRRISYLKATTAYSMNIDSENELDEVECTPIVAPQRSVLGSRKSAASAADSFPADQEQLPVIKEGNVFCKVIQVEGKKASDRSWKPIWLILKGCLLYLVKEKKESLFAAGETPATFDKSDLGASCDRLDIRCSMVEVANDYTKRKHVLRLNAPSVGTELLLQAQDANSMSDWVRVLRQQAVASPPPPPPPNTSVVEPSPQSLSTNVGGTSVASSPSACNKTLRKLASLRTRSPTAAAAAASAAATDVPSSKAKKQTLNDFQQTSPKTKTWKNKMAKQFRKIQPGANSPLSSAVVTYPAGSTIGIPLEMCPCSTFSEYVPLIVQVCTSIVEAKGLEIIGIYRVPGNTAAVTSLTEAVNRGLEMSALDQDPRWSDVNVISSLLKSFFRKLPDALLTTELYQHFIKSDAIEDPIQRMITIRKLVHELPDHNFETLKYLLFHLKKVVANSSVNKMEARNLAIVFGPTLIRSGDDMFTMVTDMSHQCRIVESLLSHVDWCFGDGDVNDLKTSIPQTNSVPELEATSSSHTLLLSNIRKVEECMQSPTTAKDFVSTIIGAANRKMHKASKHSSSKKTTSSAAAAASTTTTTTTTTVGVTVVASNTATGSNATSGGFEDTPDSAVSAVQPTSRLVSTAIVEKNQSKTHRVRDENGDSAPLLVRSSDQIADVGRRQRDESSGPQDSVSWTYPKISAETRERIRKFEEETEALLQRCGNPRRLSGCISEETEKEKEKEKEKENATATITNKRDNSSRCKSNDSPPPVVVTRRNLPNVCKKSSRLTEFVPNNSMEKSTSLESLNRHPDDGCDLLLTLTSTFDKKLKSLSSDTSLCEQGGGDAVSKTRYEYNMGVGGGGGCARVDRNSSFRDPSLHRNLKKSCKTDTIQKTETNVTDKENDQHDREKERKDVDEKQDYSTTTTTTTTTSSAATMVSCAACGCSVAHSEAIQQNCDNWKRSVLQEMQSHQQQQQPQQNRFQNTAGVSVKRGESKLFYSNSVKLRRSESLKEDSAAIKLRRSGSLNKYEHEPSTKITKFESLMLIKNADAIKLRRADSLTKSEKTETNLKRRQHAHNSNNNSNMENGGGRKARGGGGGGNGNGGEKESKLKRRNGVNKCRNIKRRHTVGGTKDFDKVSWLHGQQQQRSAVSVAVSAGEMDKENRKQRRTSSPDLSSAKAAATADFLVEVVVRPRSFIAANSAAADPNFVSRLLNIPLESHV